MSADRGLSVALDYVIMLGIATVVLASVGFVAGDVVDSQHDRAVEEELRATGEKLATDIQSAERLANAGNDTDNTTVEFDSHLPRLVSGTSYSITVNGTTGELQLETTRPEAQVTVPFRADRVTDEYTIRGGTVRIVLTDGRLEVENP